MVITCIVILVILIIVFQTPRKRWTCTKCGASWPEEEKKFADGHTLYHAGHDMKLK